MIEDITRPRLRKRLRASRVIVIVVLLIVAAVAGIFGRGGQKQMQHYFPVAISKQVSFQLYYPTKLPADSVVVPGSIQGNNQAVFYIIRDNSGRTFNVSLQSLPQNFDYDAFKNKFTDTDETLSNIGSVLTGDVGTGLIASIRTAEGSWILINTTDTNAGSELQSLTYDFTKTN